MCVYMICIYDIHIYNQKAGLYSVLIIDTGLSGSLYYFIKLPQGSTAIFSFFR